METLIEKHVKEIQLSTDQNFSPYYNMLPELINQRGYQYGIEIGVFSGGHAKAILERTKLKLLLGIDPYKEYSPDQINMGTIVSQQEFDIMFKLAVERMDPNRFQLLRMTSDDAFSYIFNTGKKIADLMVAFLGKAYYNKFDFVFIDGLHEAEQLSKDLDNYDCFIRNGGVISGHDINHGMFPGLTPVIYSFAQKHNAEVILGPFHAWYINKTWD
jgi:hypothetical protein